VAHRTLRLAPLFASPTRAGRHPLGLHAFIWCAFLITLFAVALTWILLCAPAASACGRHSDDDYVQLMTRLAFGKVPLP
jgi:hypothetical protein